jgi:hypothetical protein
MYIEQSDWMVPDNGEAMQLNSYRAAALQNEIVVTDT